MSNQERIDIALTQLDLDVENSRLPKATDSQVEVIEWMTNGSKKIGEKIFVLAKDIMEFGLNPAELVMVQISDQSTGRQKYIVLEGNRRVTALKLLNNPDLAPSNHWRSKYSQLVRNSENKPPKRVPCVVIDDRTLAFHFMENKHLGELGGAGIVAWGSEEKARHQQRENKRSREFKALAVLDHVRNSSLYGAETKHNAGEGFPVTTLDRILGDKEFRDFIGISFDPGKRELYFTIEPAESAKAISKLIDDFGGKKEKVQAVINKGAREKYMQSFVGTTLPDHKKILTIPVAVNGNDRSAVTPPEKPTTATVNPAPNHPYQSPTNRSFLVLAGTKIAINGSQYNRHRRVYTELKALPINSGKGRTAFPNAAAVLVRTFIELSLLAYIERYNLTNPGNKNWVDVRLIEKVKIVFEDLKNANALTPAQSKVMDKTINNPKKPGNPNTMNDFVHSAKHFPTPAELIDLWDTWVDMLSAIWQRLR